MSVQLRSALTVRYKTEFVCILYCCCSTLAVVVEREFTECQICRRCTVSKAGRVSADDGCWIHCHDPDTSNLLLNLLSVYMYLHICFDT